MSKNRRDFFRRIGSMGAGLVVGAQASQAKESGHAPTHRGARPDAAKKGSKLGPEPIAEEMLPVETPDVPKLPWKMVDGAREFHLVAEPVRTEFVPGRVVDAWGDNGSVPGPTIEANEGDRVRVVFENQLPEMTTVHWHGLEVPMAMDGVPGLGQDPVMPGGRFVYEFTLYQHGTFFYHSHFAMQEMAGMIGMFILHPTKSYEP